MMDDSQAQKELEKKLWDVLNQWYSNFGYTEEEIKQRFKSFLNIEEDRRKVFEYLQEKIGSLNGKNILDVGCAIGGFVIAASKEGANAFGVEPDIKKVALSKLKAERYELTNKFIIGVGEYLPFKGGCFDVVHCYMVLEHVKDVPAVIREMARVTKKGGWCHIATANYLWPSEAHYRIFYIPLLPKPLAKIYIRFIFFLKRRKVNPDMIDEINYVTARKTEELMKINGFEIKNLYEEGMANGFLSKFLKAFKFYPVIDILGRRIR